MPPPRPFSPLATASPADMLTARALLDDALVGLRGIADPRIPVRDAECELAAALLHTYRALASTGDARVYDAESASALSRGRAALGVLQQIVTEDPGVEADMVVVARAVQVLARHPLPPEQSPLLPGPGKGVALLRATLREPQLLDPARTILYPAVPLPALPDAEPAPPSAALAPPPAPTLATDEDIADLVAQAHAALGALADEPPPTSEKLPAPEPLGPPDLAALEEQYVGAQREERDVILDRARSCFEDLAAFSMMRKPQSDEGWMSATQVERRMLARIDAILACGLWVMPRLVKVIEDRAVPDPDMTWASVFLFASLAGADALDQGLRVVRAADLGSPGMAESVADALTLAPHPGIEPAMRAWLDEPDPLRRAIAVETLGRRRVITVEQATVASTDRDERVVLAAAEALGAALGDVPARTFEPLLQHANEAVTRAALFSAIARRSQQGYVRAAELTAEGRGHFADAAAVVAIAGDAKSQEVLRHSHAGAQKPNALIEAVGWHGDLAWIDYLVSQLRSDVPTTQVLAVEALQLLTGASLTESDPAPEYATDALPLSPGRSVMPEDTGPLLLDAEVWSAWWKRYRPSAQPGKRYRYGHLWSPRDDLWQLANPESGTRTRALAHLELVVRLGGSIPLDGRDFVVRQERLIAEWTEYAIARRERAAPGSWATNYAR